MTAKSTSGQIWNAAQSCPFCLKIGTQGILEVLIPNLNLDFWNFKLKTHFGLIWIEKGKIIRFAWKLAHILFYKNILSRVCTKQFKFHFTFLSNNLFWCLQPLINLFLLFKTWLSSIKSMIYNFSRRRSLQ